MAAKISQRILGGNFEILELGNWEISSIRQSL
jgi:hypothetical protein